ncbi:hypothetical protein TYRP_022105 [Tyrophagus putrescentiae]|nr:hypothetical protein TYRP_022105 [Tyrophagus putrescentiae]
MIKGATRSSGTITPRLVVIRSTSWVSRWSTSSSRTGQHYIKLIVRQIDKVVAVEVLVMMGGHESHYHHTTYHHDGGYGGGHGY